MLVRNYDKEQEDEADWLAGCILLPRVALISIVKGGLDAEGAAAKYGVSTRMLTYRLAISGYAGSRLSGFVSPNTGHD